MNNEEYDFAKLQSKLDYYKHEYYSECDRSEKLERALDKACERIAIMCLTYTDCDDPICPLQEDNCQRDCKSKEAWKEWCLIDE